MLDSILSSGSSSSASITWGTFLICTVFSVIYGVCIALIFMYKNNYSRNFVVTLALLPVIVQSVVMSVSGNIGTGVAALGAFSLIRFRSLPGNAKEIGSIFFAMAIGLATGMGYLVFAGIFFVTVGGLMILMTVLRFGEKREGVKELKITIPENIDYTDVFNDIFDNYTKTSELVRVKTSNMGSLYDLQYAVTMKDGRSEKEFIDQLRCRNGNLNISLGRSVTNGEEL